MAFEMFGRDKFLPSDYRAILRKEPSVPTPTVINGVVIEKPFWQSKKVWLTAIALGVALYQAFTGRHADLTPAEVTDKIVTTAQYLGPILALIMGIAHVDANVRSAVIAADATAKSLNDPEPPAQVKS